MKQAKDGKGNLILLLEEYERRKRKTSERIGQNGLGYEVREVERMTLEDE